MDKTILNISDDITWHLMLAKDIQHFTESVKTAIRISGKRDNRIALEQQIDPGNFSRMINGLAPYCASKIPNLCEILGNDLIVMWLGWQRGYEMHKPENMQPINDLKEKIKEQEIEIRILRELLSKK